MFSTPGGIEVPAISADQMRTVDRIATEVFGLSLAQMIEHAGRTLARQALDFDSERTVVLAGNGGNGGGGLACARHLAARGRLDSVVLDRQPDEITGATATQLGILDRMDVPIVAGKTERIETADLLVDALIGYGLTGPPHGTAAALIDQATATETPVVSLDVPSGVDATTGETPGVAIKPAQTLTLALPKTGLDGVPGALWLGDLGIPAAVYEAAAVAYSHPFGDSFSVALTHNKS